MSRSDHRELRNRDLKLGWVVGGGGGGGWVYRANADTALVQMEQSLQELVNFPFFIRGLVNL